LIDLEDIPISSKLLASEFNYILNRTLITNTLLLIKFSCGVGLESRNPKRMQVNKAEGPSRKMASMIGIGSHIRILVGDYGAYSN